MHRDGARLPDRPALLLEPLRISGGQHHGRVGRQADGELGADFAAAAEDHDDPAIGVLHKVETIACASVVSDAEPVDHTVDP
jgi:hypothetical protein